MKKDWLGLLFGQVTFSALGGQYEHFLDDCTRQGLPLCRITPCPGGFTARIAARRYRALHPLARRRRVRLRIMQRCRRVRHRPGLWLGAAAFCGAVLWMQQLVWSVQFVQLPPEQRSGLHQQLCALELGEGAVVTEEKLRRAEQLLLSRNPSLGWLSLNFLHGRLVVESAPAVPPPPVAAGSEGDLIAAADGTLLSLNVQEGHCDRRPGQTVAQGDVLVRARRTGPGEDPLPTRTRAQILALVSRTYECSQPRSYTAGALTGKLQTALTLCIAGRRLPLDRTHLSGGKTVFRPVTFLGLPLPALVEERTAAEKASVKITISRRAAEDFARFACRKALERDFPDASVRTESTDVFWQEEVCRVRVTVKFCADIARPR